MTIVRYSTTCSVRTKPRQGFLGCLTEMFEKVSAEKGLVWEEKLKEWKAGGQWHIEVY